MSEEIKEYTFKFHNTYERLAPNYGYETRKDTKEFDFNSNNGKLMYATVNEIISPLLQKVEQLENENFNIRENIHLERISLPPELTKDKNFMELYDIPSYEDLKNKVEQLEKDKSYANWYAVKKEKEVEQLENIRKEATEYNYKLQENYSHRALFEDKIAVNVYKVAEENLNILNKGSESDETN